MHLEGTSFDYDDNGNQIERGTDTFEYDHENRLVETVSGTMMWMACGAQRASNPIAGGICVSAAGWYLAATGVKYFLADSACEKKVVLGTAVIGLAPPIKYVGSVIAGSSSGFEALGCPTTAHAWGANAGTATTGSKE
ncbi:MAG: hypothetical protein WD379_06475 [Dehalococcoidia bacterium]